MGADDIFVVLPPGAGLESLRRMEVATLGKEEEWWGLEHRVNELGFKNEGGCNTRVATQMNFSRFHVGVCTVAGCNTGATPFTCCSLKC